MRTLIGRYQKPNGTEEVRLYFPQWELPDGRIASHVTIHPHPCGTCVGGDHTHVEISDTREPVHVILKRDVEFHPAHRAALDTLLSAKMAVDHMTRELVDYLT